jgi:hypothetical protein
MKSLLLQRLKANGYNEKTRRKAMDDVKQFMWSEIAKRTLDVYKLISTK